MKITCVAVGKKHDINMADAIAEFEKRLTGFCDYSWHLIPSSDKDQESNSILKFLKEDDIVILLDERGATWSNEQLASKINSFQNGSVKRLVIIIGGAFGVTKKVQTRSNYMVALSSLVFPHQLVRLIIVEQLYRTYSILADGKYHHQ